MTPKITLKRQASYEGLSRIPSVLDQSLISVHSAKPKALVLESIQT